MKGKLLIFTGLVLALVNYNSVFSQNKSISPFTGQWINIQYEHFKNYPQSETILFHISPWFINIDSTGKCTIESLYEQKTEIGYPVSKKEWNGEWEYHYRRVWLYNIKGNDSLLIYRNGDAPPGAGIIFKRYNK